MKIPQVPKGVPFLTPKDIQERLKVGKTKATDYAKEMEHYRIGRLIRVPEESYEKWLEVRKKSPYHVMS